MRERMLSPPRLGLGQTPLRRGHPPRSIWALRPPPQQMRERFIRSKMGVFKYRQAEGDQWCMVNDETTFLLQQFEGGRGDGRNETLPRGDGRNVCDW